MSIRGDEYFAGFFDGEGCVGIYNNNGNQYASRAEVRVVNTNLSILEEGKNKYGGNIYQRKKRVSHYKQSYDWVIVKQSDVRIFLDSIAPYLLVKHEVVHEVIDILKRNSNS